MPRFFLFFLGGWAHKPQAAMGGWAQSPQAAGNKLLQAAGNKLLQAAGNKLLSIKFSWIYIFSCIMGFYSIDFY
jgi:hypothetical protein